GQGSYGLRPFLPWSAQWYYGDWVAIVDPFFWVVPLVGLAWGARRHWAPALVYLVTLLGVTTLVLWRGHDLVVWWVRLALVGCAAAGVVGWTRHWFGVAGRGPGGAAGVGGVRAVPCGGGRFEQRRCPRIAVGRALPRTRVGRRRLGDRAGPAPLMRLDWAAR